MTRFVSGRPSTPLRTAIAAVPSLAGAVLAAALLAGCSGNGPLAAAATGPDHGAATPSAQPSPSATVPPSVTATAAPTVTASPTTSATASPTAKSTLTPSWPKSLGEPQQGDPVWAVYLAIGHSASDPVIDKAFKAAAKVGYQAVVGDLACDAGSMQALGLDEYDYWSGATLYFATEKDARTFTTAYTAKAGAPKGVVKVKVGCLD